MRFFAFILPALCLVANNALAEHEIDHRYNVRGYVLDDQEEALVNQEVQVFDGASLLARTKTDSSGFYSMYLHLHNEDKGKEIRLRTGSGEADIQVSFDPADDTTQRVHDANIVGGKLVEGSLNRFRIPSWIYPLAGLFAIGFILVMLEKRRRKKLRHNLSATGSGKGRGGRKGKKRKSRSH
jgi:hypothetical protein